MRYLVVRTCLALAAATAAAGLIQVIVWPRWPQAAAVGLDRLQLQGGELQPARQLLPATREASLAQSALLEFQLPDPRPGAAGAGLADAAAPMLLRVRVIEPRNWRSFQVATITKGIGTLELGQRTMKVRGEDEVAMGKINGQPALQSCLTEGGFGAVTQKTFFPLSFEKPSKGLNQQLDRILGLHQNREIRCLLVTLLIPAVETESKARLLEAWSQLRPSLTSALAMNKQQPSAPSQ